METTWQVGKYLVKEVLLERAVNYEVFDAEGYVCRLVPGYEGFELSKMDVGLGLTVDDHVVAMISNFILAKDN
ncbi:hypothetical protein ACFOW1_06330 [Parasediminibacterium paludis]|uniref:Uncharacterized protein n=1 Tax=Parasediminibacterium paludis TaxID=908966 RepID=A0ABV8PWW5_9BACT